MALSDSGLHYLGYSLVITDHKCPVRMEIGHFFKKISLYFSFAEIATLIHFVLLAVLWLTREPEFMPGWAVLFEDG